MIEYEIFDNITADALFLQVFHECAKSLDHIIVGLVEIVGIPGIGDAPA